MIWKKAFWLAISLMILTVQPGYGWKMFSADAPDSGLLGNSFVDILYHEGTIWLASGSGLSYSTDQGQSWYTLTTQSGLISNEPSAMFGRPGEIWVSGTHFETYEDINYPFGNGIDVSRDGGQTWVNYDPPEASGFANLVYDLTGTDSSTYAACFHGGLIVNHDKGATDSWSHMFFAAVDSADWFTDQWADLVTGRYYSCLADTLHNDTLIVYGGSANGIHKFLYLPKRVKLGGDNISDFARAGDFLYLAHDRGISQGDISRGLDSLESFYTSDSLNGLGGNWARRLVYAAGRLWAGVFNPSDSSGLGLYYLDDPGTKWTVMEESMTGPPDLWNKHTDGFFEGGGSGVHDFKNYHDSILYIAAGDSGVFRSDDSGASWQRFYVDSLDMNPASPRNIVYSVDATGDSLYLGTRAGLVKASFTPPFTIDFDTLITFEETDSTGSVVTLVRHNDGENAFTWLAVAPQDPLSGIGNYAALFLDTAGTMLVSIWSAVQTQIYDFAISDSLTVIATNSGLFGSLNLTYPPTIVYSVVDFNTGISLEHADFYAAEFIDTVLAIGASEGLALNMSASDWRIHIANTNSRRHDLAVARTRANSGLPGDWVVALELQVTATDTVLWAACRRVTDTLDQVNAIAYSTDFGSTWNEAVSDQQAWNFAFDENDYVYAAASGGLFYSDVSRDNWQQADIIDPVTRDTIIEETGIYAVEAVDTILWVGTELGLAMRPITDVEDWSIVRIFKETESADEVYAAPVPYSPINFAGRLSLHYHVETDASITVEIYDFAMNLVKTVTEDRFRAGGADYHETWDGYNEEGDMVATGFYFFKVSYSTGEQRWGRLAIIP